MNVFKGKLYICFFSKWLFIGVGNVILLFKFLLFFCFFLYDWFIVGSVLSLPPSHFYSILSLPLLSLPSFFI